MKFILFLVLTICIYLITVIIDILQVVTVFLIYIVKNLGRKHYKLGKALQKYS